MPQAEVDKIIDAALDSGINFIDTANVYNEGRSEETLGHALKGRMDQVVLATKFNFPRKTSANSWGASRYHMIQSVEQSLRRLQTDHIALYYCHRWDETTPIEETLRGLDDLIRMGKICYIGASAYASWQLAHANVLAELKGWSRFVVLQSEYNMLKRERRARSAALLPGASTSASCRTIRSPAVFSPANTRWANRRRRVRAAIGARRPRADDREKLSCRRATVGLGARSRPRRQRVGAGLADGAAERVLGDHRREKGRACDQQRESGGLEARQRRAERDRSDLPSGGFLRAPYKRLAPASIPRLQCSFAESDSPAAKIRHRTATNS